MAPKKEKINKKNKDGLTPLHIAAEKGNLIQLQKLLSNEKTDVNCENDAGDTPLYTAVNYEQLDVVQQLLKHPKVDVNNRSKDGRTPLKCAVYSYHGEKGKTVIPIIKELLKHPDIELNDENGETVLFNLIQKDNFEVAELLVQGGADLKHELKKLREQINKFKKFITAEETKIKNVIFKMETDTKSLNQKNKCQRGSNVTEIADRKMREKKLQELTKKFKEIRDKLVFEFFDKEFDKWQIKELLKKDFDQQVKDFEEEDEFSRFYIYKTTFTKKFPIQNKKLSELKQINFEINKLKDKFQKEAHEKDKENREANEILKRERQLKDKIRAIRHEITNCSQQKHELERQEEKLIKFAEMIGKNRKDLRKWMCKYSNQL